jgi:hypothetical protein
MCMATVDADHNGLAQRKADESLNILYPKSFATISATILGLFAALAMLWVGVQPAAAQQDVFVVQDVEVDATADDANAAREVALEGGMRSAYHRLLRRLSPRSFYDRHEELEANRIAALVYGIEVGNERTSATRYLANLSISFQRAAVRALLRGQGIPFAETASKPLLVLPVFSTAGTELLWDDPNPWRSAWGLVRGRDSLLPLVIPNGDLTNVALIGAGQAIAGNRSQIAAIAGRYGVEDALVAHATLTTEIASRAQTLNVALHRFGPAGNRTTVESFRGQPQEPIEDFLARAVKEIAIRLEEQWKADTLLETGAEARLAATVPIIDLADWVAIRAGLEQAPEVTNIVLSEISKSAAHVEFDFFGGPRRLVLALAQRDIQLASEDGFWVLRLISNLGAR